VEEAVGPLQGANAVCEHEVRLVQHDFVENRALLE
jgi:hypothetical protein